mmetsp:Transcript_20652/g.53132  ORF Transcript_20652/g.53132 Transcript_20652/m.53132 type:complete len:291 (-) Transcript_20652:498-1370(-)
MALRERISRIAGNLTQELHFARAVAVQAGTAALRFANASLKDLGVLEKHGEQGPVTIVDKKLNELIVSTISSHYPNDGIVAEESNAAVMGTSGRRWFVDPIDGTRDYIKRNGQWSVMIGMAVDDVPVLGVVFQPMKARLYSSSPTTGATLLRPDGAETPLKASTQDDPAEMTLVKSWSTTNGKVQKLSDKLNVKDSFFYGSLGLRACLIAENRAGIYATFSGKSHLWDACAPEAILIQAGGRFNFFDGSHPNYAIDVDSPITRPYVICPDSVWPRIYDVIRRMEEEEGGI